MLENGMFLVDRYEVIGKVGTGGMSDVYKAKDHILGRIVAIKVLKQEFSEDINFVTKFRTEAQSAAGLEHPNIVNIYDVGSESGMHFIVMEYVEGITLKTYIEKKGQLSFKEATSIAIQVARGIEAAHNKDITHRDIKPQNIMISTDGKVKVTDFGIAKAISSNTISSDAMGSVHYASPEQARNGLIDGRSDIYSLGVVMYEMVTGRVPFDGETTVAVALQHLQEEMVAPSTYAPELPISYERIVLKTTQKSPERRYQTIAELLSDLRKALTNPDEDFVEIAPLVLGNTRVINGDELGEIQKAFDETDMDNENGFVTEELDDDEEYDEDDEYDEDASGFLDPKMEKMVTIAGVAILALIVIIILFIVGSFISDFFKFGSKKPTTSTNTEVTQMTEETEDTDAADENTEVNTENQQVEMISIVDMSVEEATAKLQELGLSIEIMEYRDSNKKDGIILEQSESKGTMLDKGTVIKVIIAGSNEELIEVPNVVGATESDAVKSIEAKGFKVTRDFATSNDVEAGRVISQSPADGEAPENSYIVIVISEGKGKALVPGDLVGKDINTVTAKLESLGFVVNRLEAKSDAYPTAGTVISVAGAGAQKDIGSAIDVTVSSGPQTVAPDSYAYDKTWDNADATYCEFSLTDANGTVMASGTGTNKVRVTASGMPTSTGELTIKWYKDETVVTKVPSEEDLNEDGVVDENDYTEKSEKKRTELSTSKTTVSFDKE